MSCVSALTVRVGKHLAGVRGWEGISQHKGSVGRCFEMLLQASWGAKRDTDRSQGD